MAKKTYNEKLNSPGDLPKIEDLSGKPEAVARMGGAKMLIAEPMAYNRVMARIPDGRVTTVDRVRAYLADKAGADTTCPLTAGILRTFAPTPARNAPTAKSRGGAHLGRRAS